MPQVTKSPQHDVILALLASTFHCVTQLLTLSQSFSNNLFIHPSNLPFLHPCFLVLIVFGSFILHDDGGEVVRFVAALTHFIAHLYNYSIRERYGKKMR